MSESIYSWIKETPPPPEKPAMYHSKFAGTMPVSKAHSSFGAATTTKSFGSMGRTVKESVKPTAFLKAHEKTDKVDITRTLPGKYVRPEEPKKAPVPKRDETPLHGLVSGKDFIVSNAVEAILAVPKKLTPKAPDYLHKEDYGKVPSYLERIKTEIEEEHEYIQSLLDQQQMEEEAASGHRMHELTDGEREELIYGLKNKWDEVNKAYQRITFKKISTSNSSIGEIRFKENCEKTLAQIEKDINRLQVRAPIFVVDDGAATMHR